MRWYLLLLISAFIIFFCFRGHEYFTPAMLVNHHITLQVMVHEHYGLAVVLYILIYIVGVLLSLPVTAFLGLVGGFLFGPFALLYVLLSAMMSSACVFKILRSPFCVRLTKKINSKMIEKIEKEFQKNTFSYVLSLRFLPLPFSFVNILASLLDIKFRTYLIATFLGIIPINCFYVMLGHSLNSLLASNGSLNNIQLWKSSLLWVLIALSLLTLCFVFYKRYKCSKTPQSSLL